MKTLAELNKDAANIGSRIVPDGRAGCFNYYDRENAHAFCVNLREASEHVERDTKDFPLNEARRVLAMVRSSLMNHQEWTMTATLIRNIDGALSV